jgi:hypothetical protein
MCSFLSWIGCLGWLAPPPVAVVCSRLWVFWSFAGLFSLLWWSPSLLRIAKLQRVLPLSPCLNKVSPFLNCFGGSWNEIQTAQLRFGGEVAGGGRIKHLELEVVLIVSPGPNSVWGFCF